MKMTNSNQPLLKPFELGKISLKNRIVMSSLTRCRVTNISLAPSALQALYYAQRASAGLIITESTWISRKAIGYINIPGIYSEQQIEGWRCVTKAVHDQGGKIFLQIVHFGAASHPIFLEGKLPLGPSAINPMEKTFTPQGFKDTVTPEAFTMEDIKNMLDDFRIAAKNARLSGFDGIELHAHIFALIPQFLSKATNQRSDRYGGNIQNRSRILFEILDVLTDIWGSKAVGIKFTPTAFNQGIIKPDEDTIDTYNYILSKLNSYDLAYIHLVGPATDLKDTAVAVLQDNIFSYFRKRYHGTIIANLGFDKAKGNAILESGNADLVSYGTLYIANPDLVERFAADLPLADADKGTFYTGGEKGYADYPYAR